MKTLVLVYDAELETALHNIESVIHWIVIQIFSLTQDFVQEMK